MTTTASHDRVREQVRRWANELIDLSKRNTSLYYRPLKRGTLEVVQPSGEDLLQWLQEGALDFYLPSSEPDRAEGVDTAPSPEDEMEVVTNRTTAGDVTKSLSALARQAEADFTDKGLRSLYLCCGLLTWREAEEADDVRSPLLFVPVTLHRASPRDPYRLSLAEEDPTANLSLQVALAQQYDLRLPDPDFDEVFAGGGLTSYLEEVGRLVRERGWSVAPHLVIKRATFHKEAMFRDLQAHLEEIMGHELVAALADPDEAERERELSGSEPPDEDMVDEVQPPEQARLILDADASQRRAIHAGVSGTSFVMDGPPGSGKSQTIANLLAELIAAGKSVLFVSEKIAALEVVASRLAERGLDHFLFELHSHKLSRKEVAQELGRTLQLAPVARPHLAPATLREARNVRRGLSDYAEALNRVRDPLGRSVGWVVGRLSQLHALPDAPPPGNVDLSLEAAEVAELTGAFDSLAQVWEPVEEGDRFAWNGLAAVTFSDGLRASLERTTAGLAQALTTTQEMAEELALRAGLALPESLRDAGRVAAVLAHVSQGGQPATEADWWVTEDLQSVITRATELQDTVHQRHVAIQQLDSSYADGRWVELPVDGAARLQAALTAVKQGTPHVDVPERFDAELLDRTRRFCSDTTALVGRARVQGRVLAEALGATDRNRTPAELRRLAVLATRADETVRPEAAWTAPVVRARLEQAIGVLAPLVEDYQRRHAELAQVFDDEVYDLDLQGLITRFDQTHRGVRKLSAGYREDKRAVAAVAKAQKASPDIRARLPEARDLQELRSQLDAAEQEHLELLGVFYRPRSTDTDAAGRALETLRLASDVLGEDYDQDRVAAQLAGSHPEDHALGRRGSELIQQLDAWHDEADDLDLVEVAWLPLSRLEEWGEQTAAHVGEAIGLLTDAAARRLTAPTVHEVCEDLRTRSSVAELEAQIDASSRYDREFFGAWYAGAETDFPGLHQALMWTQELQERHGGPLPNEAVDRLRQAPDAPAGDELGESLRTVEKHRSALVGHFSDPRSEEIDEQLDYSFSSAREIVGALAGQTDRIEQWIMFRQNVTHLAETGWDAPVDFCISERIGKDDLPAVLEKALYSAWFDAASAADTALQGTRSDRLDAMVVKFRKLDHDLIDDAAEHVVAACVGRRPKTAIGMARIIEGEANKKRRHMPVRTLLEKTADVTRALKPCFMMSPLAVSQYLPDGFSFDAVVFDEASQITPADAVNCIYRGRQLIVAGDDNQLPPTSFFQAGGADDSDEYEEGQFDEFESILAQCKRTPGMYSLPLRWHYRSQHESLITFSNYRFYEGRLVTFPGAQDDAPDLGVKLLRVDGVYRRGGPRDNPIEAQAVAERVLHYAETFPDLSLGVVAFSDAQADTIANAIERARLDRPELDAYFSPDRLDGFFVKNLESVQGDERDVMLFSIGYGPDENGKLTMNFGPLNRQGGWRRLNVAITRARRRVEVVASFGAGQMDTRGSTNESLKALQRYLDYAERGLVSLSLDLSQSEGDVESPLEASVLDTLRAWGHKVVPQLGASGYRLDLAIRHPEQPGRFLLGVECDGAMYHSSRVARDRDRLRQEVLERLGWRLHRVWGPSWYRDRAAQEERLRAAIEAALAGEASPAVASARRDNIEREVAPVALDEVPPWAKPYQMTSLKLVGLPPHDPRAWSALRKAVERVLHAEAPIHEEFLAKRISWEWGGFNTTKKNRKAVDDMVLTLSRQGLCERHGPFIWVGNDFDIRISPEMDDLSRRPIEYIPPEELTEAVYRLLQDSRACTSEELLTQVGRLFGFKRIGAKIQVALDEALAQLEEDGHVTRDANQVLRVVDHDG